MNYCLWNDQVVKESAVHVSFSDRGYHFGDGVYEMIRLYDGHFFALQPHLDRLYESTRKIDMTLPYTPAGLTDLLQRLIEKNDVKNGSVYLQVTRGTSVRNHLYTRTETPILSARTLQEQDHHLAQTTGIATYVTEDIRWLRCDIKSLNLLGNVMAKRAAADAECAEAIFHRDGIITEGASSNVFLVSDDTLYTHPANHLILNGITRQKVIELAKKLQINVIEEPFPKEVLAHADEAFITGTLIEIIPIHSFLGDTTAKLPVGPITQRIQNAFAARIAQAANTPS